MHDGARIVGTLLAGLFNVCDDRAESGEVAIMLSQELEFSLNAAFQSAREKRHEYITVEHLLSALLDNPSAARVLRACGGNLDGLRRRLIVFLRDNVPGLRQGR